MLAQLVNILYNVVDRVFIGHIGSSTLPLTGVGLCMPVITVISAFSGLFGMGGAPLCSIARGQGDLDEAERVQNTSFVLLVATGMLLTALGECFLTSILRLFGASADTLPYAAGYLRIYLAGTVFVMIALGMNYFINAQGFARIGMLTVLLGAGINLVLDPLLIFVLGLGVLCGRCIFCAAARRFCGCGRMYSAGTANASGASSALACPTLLRSARTVWCKLPATPPCRPLAGICTSA